MSNNIQKIIDGAKKNFSGIEMYSEVDPFKDVNFWVSSGVPEIDLALTTFGYPPGILEVSGKSRSGKSTLGLTYLAQGGIQGAVNLFISSETRENKIYAETIGVDIDSVLLHRVKTIEDIFDRARDVMTYVRSQDKDIPICILVDSLGATPTKAEKDADDDQQFMAVAARVIKGRLRKIVQDIHETNTVLFIINQRYSKIGGMIFGDNTESYGGEGPKLASQIRFKTTLTKTLKDSQNEKFGQETTIEVLKSDFSLPNQKIKTEMIWGIGFIPTQDMLQLACEFGLLKKNGANGFSYGKKKTEISWKKRSDFYKIWAKDPQFRFIFNPKLISKIHKEVKVLRGV